MNRRDFLKQCAVTGIAGSISSAASGAGAQLGNKTFNLRLGKRRYNVLFVFVDQWRFCSLGHGPNHDPDVITPNLDKLAKQGAHWSRCYATHPVCTPNRSAVITGRWPWQTGMNQNDLMLPPEERCIAQHFTEAGYKSHYIGKWHMDGNAKPGFVPQGWRRRGFTTFEGFNRGHFYFNSPTFTNDGDMMRDIGLYESGDYEPTLQADLAIDFMRNNQKNPFFCFVSWGPPHGPYTPPAEYDIYNASEMTYRPNVPDDKVGNTRQEGYFGSITALDHEFGRLMKSLKDLDLEDDTLVVFTADHGDMIYSHGLSYKGKPEEESWHIPLLMRLPGKIDSGQITDTLISTADLMPTVMSLAGLDDPTTCTGIDKTQALNGGHMPDASVYGGVQDRWRAVVKGDHKLIVEQIDGNEVATRMYNLSTDPYEMTNIINETSVQTVKDDLWAEYLQWKDKTQDSFPEYPWLAENMY
ncbi:Arylsulfatase [Anaerohalosphaera lusitana]|uniref:Arylsulfatase n=1 Tax=Anaerohalosphaera lusitana TaxID=1936003 RepID=A0A1U9NMJ8_9BACT|nr:sulfatase [Anaerohalosphaera lusitana]AQT68820.1 Arylsulfatase [Anaerohalosphaera lusitana]